MILRGNVYSKKLEMNTGISVLVPDDYKEGREYRVAYLLHGIHGDNDTWIDNTMLPIYAREEDIIFVMPSALRSFYSDTKSGQKYFSYIADELPRIIKTVFHISAEPKNTAIIGCSMGGYGAFKIGLSRPETFGFVGAFSSALLPLKAYLQSNTTEEDRKGQRTIWGNQMVSDMIAIFGENVEYNPDDDILELAKRVERSDSNPRIYMACGTKDYLHKDNYDFQNEMEKLDLNFTYEEWEGYHDWFFFDEALKKSIKMY